MGLPPNIWFTTTTTPAMSFWNNMAATSITSVYSSPVSQTMIPSMFNTLVTQTTIPVTQTNHFVNSDSTVLDYLANKHPEKFNKIIFELINRDHCSPDEYEELVMKKIHESGFVLPSGTYTLPDGAKLEIKRDDSFAIDDKDAKVKYKSKGVRNYNEFIELHGILERFVAYCATLKIRRKDFMELPLGLFLLWSIIESQKKDEEVVDEKEVLELEIKLSNIAQKTLVPAVANDNDQKMDETNQGN